MLREHVEAAGAEVLTVALALIEPSATFSTGSVKFTTKGEGN